jgi:hypothetical protein
MLVLQEQGTVQDDDDDEGERSTLDPGGHLACFDAAGLLPFDFAGVAGYAAGWNVVSEGILRGVG